MRNLLHRGVVFLEETIPAVLLAILVASVAYGVLMRYVFGSPVTWVNELAVALFVWQLFLASAGAARKHMHLGVDAFATQLSGRSRALLELLVSCAVLVVLGFFFYLGWKISENPTKELQMINLSYTYVYAAVPVGFALMFVHVAWDAVHAVRGLLGKEYIPPSSSVEALTELQTEQSASGATL